MGGKWSLVRIQSPRPFFLSTGMPRRPCPGALSPPPLALPTAQDRMNRIARAEDPLSARIADLAYRGGASFVALLPERLARGLGRAVADLCWRLSPRRRTRLMQNLKHLRPELDARALGGESRHAFRGFGESVVDTLRLTRAPG